MRSSTETLHTAPMIRGRYTPTQTLGGSLLGRTFLGTDTTSGQKVVLKELGMRDAGDWKEVELFERGARTLKSLKHPHIPKCYDAFFDEDTQRFFLVQAHIEGIDLKESRRCGATSPRGDRLNSA